MQLEHRGFDRLWIVIDHALWSSAQSYRVTHAVRPPTQPSGPLNSDLRQAQRWMRINHTGEVCAQSLFLGALCFARSEDNFNQFAALMRQELTHLIWCKERLQALRCPPSVSDPLWAVACFIMALVAGARGDAMAWSFIEETEILVIRHLRESFRALVSIDPISAQVVARMIADETHHAANAHQYHKQRTGFLPYMKPLFSILKQVVG